MKKTVVPFIYYYFLYALFSCIETFLYVHLMFIHSFTLFNACVEIAIYGHIRILQYCVRLLLLGNAKTEHYDAFN